MVDTNPTPSMTFGPGEIAYWKKIDSLSTLLDLLPPETHEGFGLTRKALLDQMEAEVPESFWDAWSFPKKFPANLGNIGIITMLIGWLEDAGFLQNGTRKHDPDYVPGFHKHGLFRSEPIPNRMPRECRWSTKLWDEFHEMYGKRRRFLAKHGCRLMSEIPIEES